MKSSSAVAGLAGDGQMSQLIPAPMEASATLGRIPALKHMLELTTHLRSGAAFISTCLISPIETASDGNLAIRLGDLIEFLTTSRPPSLSS